MRDLLGPQAMRSKPSLKQANSVYTAGEAQIAKQLEKGKDHLSKNMA